MQLRKGGNLLLMSLLALTLTAGCGTRVSDTQLATNLKAQMFSDPQTNGANLQVAVKDGVVTLSGSVPSDAARLEAYKIATNTPGVRKVEDQMTVQAPQPSAQGTPPASSPEAAAPEAAAPVEASPAEKKTDAAREREAKQERLRRAREERLRREREERASQSEAESAAQSPSEPAAASAPAPAPAQPGNLPADASAQGAAPAPAPEPPPPPQPVRAVFPTGTTVEIQTVDPIDSTKAQPGDEFQATLSQPLTWDGRVIVPAGANVYLRLVAVQTSGQYKGRSEMQLQLARLEFQGAPGQARAALFRE
jgi:hypothetical protein